MKEEEEEYQSNYKDPFSNAINKNQEESRRSKRKEQIMYAKHIDTSSYLIVEAMD
jgi:hypothetical protein